MLGSWVAGLIGCYVVGLLGFWVVGFDGFWDVGLLGCLVGWQQPNNPTTQQPNDPTTQQPNNQKTTQDSNQPNKDKKQKRQQGQKRQPNHPPTKLDGPAECAKRLNPPHPCARAKRKHELLHNSQTLAKSSHRSRSDAESAQSPAKPGGF